MALAMGGVLCGCSSSPSGVGGTGGGDGAAPDGAAATDGADDSSPDAPDDNAPPPGPARTGVPRPDGVPRPVRILDDSALLTTNDDRTCTHQDGATDDRWCAFVKLDSTTPGVGQLWVMNVTVAARGRAPVCDGSSGDCLNLSRTLATGAGAYFEGDTLIYYADRSPESVGEFLGRIYAWRPGWAHGRVLTSDRGVQCFGHLRAAVAGCLDDPTGPLGNRDTVVLRVGALTSPDGEPLPALAGTWALRNDNVTPWQAGFSPDGSVFAFTNADQAGAEVTLKTVPVAGADGATPIITINDLGRWTISNDGQRIYFERGQSGSVNLDVADFPSGDGVTTLATNVRNYIFIGDQPDNQALGVLERQPTGTTNFNLYSEHDSAAPSTLFSFKGTLESVGVTIDLAYTSWLDGSMTGHLMRNLDLIPCQINLAGEGAVFNVDLLRHGSLALWIKTAPENPLRRDGYLAAPDRCREAQRFAQGISFYAGVEDRGVLFGDEREQFSDGVTLKYAAIGPDGRTWAAPGVVRVAEQVKPPIFRTGNNPLLVLYRTIDSSGSVLGTYVFGPVPF